jgi:hypothetical protein
MKIFITWETFLNVCHLTFWGTLRLIFLKKVTERNISCIHHFVYNDIIFYTPVLDFQNRKKSPNVSGLSLQEAHFVCVLSSSLMRCLGEQILWRGCLREKSGRFPTTAARVWFQVRSCGIYGGQSGVVGQAFSENFGFPCQFLFHQPLHIHWWFRRWHHMVLIPTA